MIYNYKITITNCDNDITNIALAVSKIIISLEKLNNNFIKTVPLSVTTKQSPFNIGEIIIQINFKEEQLKRKFLIQSELIFNNISKKYKVKIKLVEKE